MENAKLYKLTRDKRPRAYLLQNKSNKRNPLVIFDKKEGRRREIRYASNSNSPFVDEQGEYAAIEPIIFEEGFLTVPDTNPGLQAFLAVHPAYGRDFIEIDEEKEAEASLAQEELLDQARAYIRQLSPEQAKEVAIDLVGVSASRMSNNKAKKALYDYARNFSDSVIEYFESQSGIGTEQSIEDQINSFFDNNLIFAKGKDIHFNLSSSKKRILELKNKDKAVEELTRHFKTPEGVSDLRLILDEMNQR